MRVDNRRFAWVWLAALALCVQLLISVPFAFAADGACAYLLAPGSSEWSSVGLDSPDASAVGCRGYAQDIEDIGTSILIAGSLDIDTITACDGGSCFHASFALAAVNRTNYWQTYPFFSRDASVNRVLAADRVLVVAGAFTGQTASTTYNNIALISKYESFSAQIDPMEGGVDGEVFAIAQLDDLLFVAGAFSRAALARPQPLPRNGGAVWNRTQGAWVEGVMPPSPTVLTAHGRVLWAASSEGGVSRLYGWDGSAWQRRCGTDDVYGQVFAVDFAPDRDFVFIGGDFTAVGALPVARLAMWDGQRWRSMGGGVRYGLWTPAVIFDVEVNGTDVYVGGRFSTAGNGSFNSLARYDTLTDQFHEVAGGFYGVVRIIVRRR